METLHTTRLTDADGRIGLDVPCIRCGYNLRGLSLEGACPECSTAVGESARGDFLRFSDPGWVSQLVSGMNWLLMSIVVGVIMGAAVVVLGIADVGGDWPGNVAVILATVITTIGYWKAAMPEPATGESETRMTLRHVVRLAAVGSLAFELLDLLILSRRPTLEVAVEIISTVIGLLAYFAVLTYARRLALRIPDYTLARHSRIVAWGIIIATLFAISVTLISAIPGASAPTPVTSAPAAAMPATAPAGTAAPLGGLPPTLVPAIIGTLGCFMIFLFLILGVWSLILLLRYRRAFQTASQQARELWARAAWPAQA